MRFTLDLSDSGDVDGDAGRQSTTPPSGSREVSAGSRQSLTPPSSSRDGAAGRQLMTPLSTSRNGGGIRQSMTPPLASGGGRQSVTPHSASTPKEELEWLPLQNHPVFSASHGGAAHSPAVGVPTNLLAWDGASRIYYWDSYNCCLHRISVRLGEPDPSSVLAAYPSKVMQADVKLNFEVQRVSINKNGSAIFLVGLDGLYVMYLYGRTSLKENTIICRTVSVGSETYFDKNNSIRTLQVSWHPYSDTHLGILSSDSVFRIFDLSSALDQPEQEYYLQPVEPGSSHNATSICPVDFAFGGDHLWDRFTVFILFSDGSVYILCPVVPFGSVYKWESVLELYSDAHMFGLKSSNSKAVKNSNLAISWLEATFPELTRKEIHSESASAIRAQPYALFDASISLQGSLRKISHGVEEDSEVHSPVCEGRAVSFLYDLVSKDSILVTAWSGGQLQIDALADEVQPVWKVGSPPRVCLDSTDRIVGLAMICESLSSDISRLKLDVTDHTPWLGHPPPLLRLANVDLALPRRSGSLISMFVDPLVSERVYCFHDGGIDSVVLHFLPFTNQTRGKEDMMKSPSVHPVLSTCNGESSSPSPLCGFLGLSDSFGDSWIVGLTPSNECIVLEMETWNTLLPSFVDKIDKLTSLELPKDTEIPTIISEELLSGPKVVLLPPSSPNLRSVTADSIEGRSTLHQYFKLFHENYVEYAHKVYFEVQHHAPHVKKIIDDQHSRLRKAQQKLLEVEKKQEKIEDRIERVVQRHNVLEERLQSLRHLPAAQRSLSKAEREFKSELDSVTGVELDALRSSIEALNSRTKRYTHSPHANRLKEHRQLSARRKSHVQEDEISLLKSSLEKLSLVNSENAKKVQAVESALKCREIGS